MNVPNPLDSVQNGAQPTQNTTSLPAHGFNVDKNSMATKTFEHIKKDGSKTYYEITIKLPAGLQDTSKIDQYLNTVNTDTIPKMADAAEVLKSKKNPDRPTVYTSGLESPNFAKEYSKQVSNQSQNCVKNLSYYKEKCEKLSEMKSKNVDENGTVFSTDQINNIEKKLVRLKEKIDAIGEANKALLELNQLGVNQLQTSNSNPNATKDQLEIKLDDINNPDELELELTPIPKKDSNTENVKLDSMGPSDNNLKDILISEANGDKKVLQSLIAEKAKNGIDVLSNINDFTDALGLDYTKDETADILGPIIFVQIEKGTKIQSYYDLNKLINPKNDHHRGVLATLFFDFKKPVIEMEKIPSLNLQELQIFYDNLGLVLVSNSDENIKSNIYGQRYVNTIHGDIKQVISANNLSGGEKIRERYELAQSRITAGYDVASEIDNYKLPVYKEISLIIQQIRTGLNLDKLSNVLVNIKNNELADEKYIKLCWIALISAEIGKKSTSDKIDNLIEQSGLKLTDLIRMEIEKNIELAGRIALLQSQDPLQRFDLEQVKRFSEARNENNKDMLNKLLVDILKTNIENNILRPETKYITAFIENADLDLQNDQYLKEMLSDNGYNLPTAGEALVDGFYSLAKGIYESITGSKPNITHDAVYQFISAKNWKGIKDIDINAIMTVFEFNTENPIDLQIIKELSISKFKDGVGIKAEDLKLLKELQTDKVTILKILEAKIKHDMESRRQEKLNIENYQNRVDSYNKDIYEYIVASGLEPSDRELNQLLNSYAIHPKNALF